MCSSCGGPVHEYAQQLLIRVQEQFWFRIIGAMEIMATFPHLKTLRETAGGNLNRNNPILF